VTARNRAAGLGATLLILVMVVGTPLLLLAIGVTPWTEDLGELGTLLTSPDDGTLALLVIGVVAWVAWVVLALSLLVEILAAIRGVTAPRLPGLAIPQGLAGRLVATAALFFAVAPVGAPVFAPQVAHAAPVVEAPPIANQPEASLAPSAAPAPEAATHEETPTVDYVVRRGDSLWKIAQEHLGDGMRYREIVALNEAVLHGEPSFIDPGLTLRLPIDAAPAVDPSDEPNSDNSYVVEAGDTLWDVAEEELGDGKRYPEIFEASHDTVQADGQHLTDPNLIRPGWELTIPAAVDSPVVESPSVENPPVQTPGGKHLGPDPVEDAPPIEPPGNADTAEPAEPPAVAEPNQVDDADGATVTWLLPGLTGAGVLLAGSVLLCVRAHRRTQQRHRRPGFGIAPPPAEVRAIEKTATVAGAPAAEVIDQLDRLLRQLAAAMDEVPKLNAVEVGRETVTLHLAEAADLPTPWTGSSFTWAAHLDSPVGDEDVLPPYPLLASVGQGDDGTLWLLDFERAGSTALTGDADVATALARHLTAELALSPWTVISTVDAIGVASELSSLDSGRLRCHAQDDTAFLAHLQRDLAEAQALGQGDPEPFHALLVTGPRTSEVRALAELIRHQTSRSGFAVVDIGDAEPEDTVIELTHDGRLRVPHLELDLAAAGLTSTEATATAAIVDLTREAVVVPMPRDEGSTGWRALADHAGALITDLTEARPQGEAGGTSLLPEATQRYEAVAPTTADDVEVLAPVVSAQSRRIVEESDPQLDDDLAEWRNPESALPKLQLLGPVTVIAQGDPPSAVAERRAYFNELVTFLALHPTGVSSRQVREAFGMTQSRARTDLGYIRTWFGTDPRTGELHLPAATTSPAHRDRGTNGYQLTDVLVDLDLFRRLRARAQARGADGMGDLVAALELVSGEPFSDLRTPGWSWLLDGERVHEIAAFAVVDVAHIVATDAFSRGDLDRAHMAAEKGCAAAPYDEVCRLDLAKVAEAEGHDTLAEQILDEQVFNRTDDNLPPIDVPKRTRTVAKNNAWGGVKRAGER
jgi:nucleoid-associated protein YgaU